MAKKNQVVAQGSINKNDAAIVERIGGMLGRGLGFVITTGLNAQQQAREAFVKVVETNPEVATAMVTAHEVVTKAKVEAETRINELTVSMFNNVTEGIFSVLAVVAQKTDFTTIAVKAMELEQAKRSGPLSEHDKIWKLQEENRARELELDAKREERRRLQAEAELASAQGRVA